MKKTVFTMVIAVFSLLTIQAQNTNHPTVESLKVAYKPETSGTQSSTSMQCIPNVTVTLKPNNNAVKVYFKILNKTDNSILYQVNYALNSGVVNDSSGKKLFENSNGELFISNGQALALKPYIYQVETEDASGTKSVVYSAIR